MKLFTILAKKVVVPDVHDNLNSHLLLAQEVTHTFLLSPYMLHSLRGSSHAEKKIQTHEILTFTILTLLIIHLAYTPKCFRFLLVITFFQREIKGNAYSLFFFSSFFALFCLGVGVVVNNVQQWAMWKRWIIELEIIAIVFSLKKVKWYKLKHNVHWLKKIFFSKLKGKREWNHTCNAQSDVTTKTQFF